MPQRIPCGTWAAFLVSLALGFGPAVAEVATITLGEINPLTGRFAAHGTALHRGVLLAVEEANASPLLRVTLATRDDEGRPDRAVAAAEELITRLRAAALVGPISEVAERHKVPYVATASLDERLTQRGYRYFFRISHLQAYADSMVGVVRDLLKPRRVAILYLGNELVFQRLAPGGQLWLYGGAVILVILALPHGILGRIEARVGGPRGPV
jgi:branched-chain amino acid transport system substrate-binding protein